LTDQAPPGSQTLEEQGMGSTEGQGETEQEAQCTCWVVMRGDTAHPEGWESAEYELVPDPACPVHGRKRHPLLEDDEGGRDPQAP